jgi:hypothetical protein
MARSGKGTEGLEPEKKFEFISKAVDNPSPADAGSR